jgi:sphinganine-1-phosphate aldolase
MTDPLADLRASLKPYDGRADTFARLPERGRPREEVLAELAELAEAERAAWLSGHASGAVYQGDPGHVEFLAEAYRLHSQSNPLHVDLWPSATKFEAEIVAMTAGMLGADETEAPIVGTVSSGGTESILLAMKAYRDRAGIDDPQIVIPTTAHAAFMKAAAYFRIDPVRVPVGADMRADVAATAEAITDRTVVVVGSAPSYPHGVIDPIEQLAALAVQRGVGFHTDACLGGFVLPWARRLGRDVPPFDFAVDGVTSMSCDTHKFGYAAKGTSVVLYRDPELRHHQYFTIADWPGGLYCSPTFAGSRPGALSAACWAAMVSLGEDGYLDATRRILDAADAIKAGIGSIVELRVIGDPLFCIAFASDDVDIHRVMDAMSARGWSLNGLQRPPAVHICVTQRHTQDGVAERFVGDLREAASMVRDAPPAEGGLAPIYGAAATLPGDQVGAMLRTYMDLWYDV